MDHEHAGPEGAAIWAPLDQLKPWTGNAKKHGSVDVDAVATSIRRFGFGAPIVARRADGEIIAGHGRDLACHRLAELWERATSRERAVWHPEAIRVATRAEAVVRFVDLDEHEAHLFALADNRLPHLAPVDDDKLAAALRELNAAGVDVRDGSGFGERDLAELLGAGGTGGTDPGPFEPPADPVSRPGELYELGPHRLLCGDSTKAEDVLRLMGGELATLFSTDPPYCVDYTGMDRPVHDGKPSGKDWSHLYREVDIKDLGEFLDKVFVAYFPVVRQDAAIYIWHAHLQQPTIAATFEKHGCLLHQVLIWVKPTATFGHSYFRWRHEPCAFGWRRGHKPEHGFGQLDSVWEIDWEGKGRVVGNEHPTQKPVEIFARPMRIHTQRGGLVVEPFGGSGSQIIAAAQEGRRCYAMELSPGFCDVIRRRWTGYARSASIDPGLGALE